MTKKDETPEVIKQLLYVVIAGVVVAVANFLVKKLLPESAKDYTDIVEYILLLALIGVIFLRFQGLKGRKWTFLVIALVTVTIIATVGYFLQLALQEQRTVYLVVDASEQIDGLFTEIRPRIKLTAMSIPEQVEVGLAVLGGGLSGKNGCDDITELVAPSRKQESVSKISQAVDLLAEIKPSNYGNMQGATLYALTRLVGRRGVQQIVIVTSGIDTRCSSLDRAALDSLAKQKNIEFEIVVIAVGNLSDSDRKNLQAFTNGRLIVTGTADLPKVIEEILTISLFGDLGAEPSEGPAPLAVDLVVKVSGSASGPITYRFDCTSDGAWDRVITTEIAEYRATNLCSYEQPGNYTATIKAERQGLSFQGTVAILAH